MWSVDTYALVYACFFWRSSYVLKSTQVAKTLLTFFFCFLGAFLKQVMYKKYFGDHKFTRKIL